MVSHHVFHRVFRYVLSQHECRLHGEVYVHVPQNMSVIHSMLCFAELGIQQFEEFNSLICATSESTFC